MLTFAPADLTLAIAKATKGFVARASKPTYEYIFSIKKVLTQVLMRVNTYIETNIQHNLAGVVFASSRYETIYNKGTFVVPSFVTVCNTTIGITAAKTVVKRAELAHEAKKYDHALYNAAKIGCVNFIMSVVDKTWYK